MNAEQLAQGFREVFNRFEENKAAAVRRALCGAGFASEQTAKLAMVRSAQANTGFTKGGVVASVIDSSSPIGIGLEQQFRTPPRPLDEACLPSAADDHVTHLKAPAADGDQSAFHAAMAAQFPTVEAMHHLPIPQQASVIERRYAQPTTPRYEPTSGPPVNLGGKVQKAIRSTADQRIRKLGRLESLLTILNRAIEGDPVCMKGIGI